MSDDSDINKRYGRWHDNGGIRFLLESYIPNEQEAKFLLLKVVEQAVSDYCNLEGSDIPYAQLLWEEARDFIFDDTYWIYWGDLELSFEDILDILEIDVDAVREKASKRYREKKKYDKSIRNKEKAS